MLAHREPAGGDEWWALTTGTGRVWSGGWVTDPTPSADRDAPLGTRREPTVGTARPTLRDLFAPTTDHPDEPPEPTPPEDAP